MRSWKWLALALVIYFCGLRAHADVVFVNINSDTKEIEAVQAALSAKGEKLYVLPETPQYHRHGDFTKEMFDLADQGVRPRALIVSGHHIHDEGFFGTNGEIVMKQLDWKLDQHDTATVQNAREFFAGIQSLYLWGCYTGTEQNLKNLTGPGTLLSNVKLIVGFDAVAPLSTNPTSGQGLAAFLKNEPAFLAANKDQMFQLLQTIPANKNADFLIRKDDFFVTKNGAFTLTDFVQKCQSPEMSQSLTSAFDGFWDYYWGRKTMPVGSATTMPRALYTTLQQGLFCVGMGAKISAGESIPQPGDVVRLVLFKNVIHNFATLYHDSLVYAQQVLISAGFQNTDMITHLDEIDRDTLIADSLELNRQLKSVQARLYGTSLAETSRLIINDIENVIFPAQAVIHESWVEPGATVPSRFVILNQFPGAPK